MPEIKLRNRTHADLETKGSRLTWNETDDNFIALYEQIRDGLIAAGEATEDAEQAAKDYADALVAGYDGLMLYKGNRGNPDTYDNNYPAANKGWVFRVNIAGLIGGRNLKVDDYLIANTDDLDSGGAGLDAYWNVVYGKNHSLPIEGGTLTGPLEVLDEGSGKYVRIESEIMKFVDEAGHSLTIHGGTQTGNAHATFQSNKSGAIAFTSDIDAVKDSVPAGGDTLLKLYNSIQSIITLLNSNDVNLDSLQEIVDKLHAEEGLITALAADKINVSAIVNVLTTTVSGYVLDARAGKTLADLITAEATTRAAADLLFATLNSAHLTGVPTAPTAAQGTSTTQLATTKFVVDEISSSIDAQSHLFNHYNFN